jgi:hypothetical protein
MVRLLDPVGNVLAITRVADEGDHYGGMIDLRGVPARLLALFEEFEEIVNGQMFSFLDDIQAKIDALRLKAAFVNGQEAEVKDLQVFPSTGDASFRLAEIPDSRRDNGVSN